MDFLDNLLQNFFLCRQTGIFSQRSLHSSEEGIIIT